VVEFPIQSSPGFRDLAFVSSLFPLFAPVKSALIGVHPWLNKSFPGFGPPLAIFECRRLQLRPPNAMACIPKLETGEKLIRQFRVKLSKKAKPFLFAVSDRALYWPQQKLFTWNDPTYFRRIPHNQVQTVSLKKLAPYGIWFVSLLMIVAGLFILAAGIHLHLAEIRAYNLTKRKLVDSGIALILGGLYFALEPKGRFGLRIQTSDKSFTWKPPLLFDKPSRIHIAIALKDILETCQRTGLRVLDGHQR
jgi:hypothetical protein